MQFDTIDYLQEGTPKQQRAYQLLTQHGILSLLAAFEPILVGTIPLNIDTDTSDLDIICYAYDHQQFSDLLEKHFRHCNGFRLSEYRKSGIHAVVGRFNIDSFEIEIFGQDLATKAQMGYRHMIIEHRILTQRGEEFRQKIIELKRNGCKTEPAFAHLLHLDGDPYTELLKYESE